MQDADTYPATFRLDADTQVANWRPLVHWILGIPHFVIAQVLGYVGSAVALISWFAIVFTGSLPAGLANAQCMIIRYTIRAYTYALWMREPYPPFEFSPTSHDPGTDPAVVTFQPALTDRNRLTVALRFLWIIPSALVGAVIMLIGWFVVIIGFFVVLFTGRWPQGMRDYLDGTFRYYVRLSTYGTLLTDEYPPFSMK